MKCCFRCKEIKETKEFYISRKSKDGMHSYCKLCANLVSKNWLSIHPKAQVEHREKAKTKQRRGVTSSQANLLLKEQGGICDICKNPYPGKSGWCLDHDHLTGKNRGLLCSSCNMALGLLQDSIKILKFATIYLEKYKCSALK